LLATRVGLVLDEQPPYAVAHGTSFVPATNSKLQADPGRESRRERRSCRMCQNPTSDEFQNQFEIFVSSCTTGSEISYQTVIYATAGVTYPCAWLYTAATNHLTNRSAANDEEYGRMSFQLDKGKPGRFVTVAIFVLFIYSLFDALRVALSVAA